MTVAISKLHAGDEDFDQTVNIIIQTLERGKSDKNIPFGVFKVTGIGRFDLLEKASRKDYNLTDQEKKDIEIIVNRIDRICKVAFESDNQRLRIIS